MNAAIAQHLNVTESAIVKIEEWANVLFCVVKGIGARFVSKKVVKMELTDKQKAAWQRPHTYYGRGYQVEISNGRAKGYFNSQCGEYTSTFDFEYNPLEKTVRDPDWHLATYTQYKEKAPQHGWLTIGGGDNCTDIPLPQFPHPNELYQELREIFGYKKTVIVKG